MFKKFMKLVLYFFYGAGMIAQGLFKRFVEMSSDRESFIYLILLLIMFVFFVAFAYF